MCIALNELLNFNGNKLFSRSKTAIKRMLHKKPTKLSDAVVDVKIKCPYEGKALTPEEVEHMREKERLAEIAYAQAFLEQRRSRFISLL